LLELLAQRIDDLRLEQWEDGSLSAWVLSYLYGCLKGKDDAPAAAVYNRLWQIDVGEASSWPAPDSSNRFVSMSKADQESKNAVILPPEQPIL
jgi:hypothetical protein